MAVRRTQPAGIGPIIAVDTGLNGMGWARWNDPRRGVAAAPDRAGVIEATAEQMRMDWPARASSMVVRFMRDAWIGGGVPRVQVMEWPQYMPSTAKGLAAAGEDAYAKLAFMCGAHTWFAACHSVETILVPVRDWKGQLPKDVVERRLRSFIGTGRDGEGSAIESHAWDAVGIGLHWLGHGINGK